MWLVKTKKDYLRLKSLVDNILDSPSIGGNISIKDKNNIYIKASGVDLKKPYKRGSVAIYNMKKNKIIRGKPSMELNFHLKLKKYVLHYHPLYINQFLCEKDLATLNLYLLTVDRKYYNIVDYYQPGEELSKYITDSKPIIFLQHHGVIIHSDNINEIESYYKLLNRKFSIKDDKLVFTPDDFVLRKDPENIIYHLALKGLSNKLKSLDEEQVKPLVFSDNENFRKQKRL